MEAIGRMAGVELCARFGLAPNLRGYCGDPKFQSPFSKYLENPSKENSARLRRELSKFGTQKAYLETIAQANGIDDVYDYDVAEAFWIGNKLLDRISRDDVVGMFAKKWVGRKFVSKERADEIISNLPKKIPPLQHTFHPYVAGFVSRKAQKSAKNKDLCRPSWAKVADLDLGKEKISVKRQPVVYSSGKFVLGTEKIERLPFKVGKIPLVEDGAGRVACHWGVAVKEISRKEESAMKTYSARVISAISR
ncbi:MAG: DUF6390 family protein [Candidatus Micrarchaeia archaeon]|jgi:hypothetical protein